jgi:hypothetical protein
MKLGRALVVCAVMASTAITIWAGYRALKLTNDWQELSSRLTMSSGQTITPSTSMEPYEINLRRMEVNEAGKETGRVLEWKLSVPRAYLFDEVGKNGEAYSLKDYRNTRYGVVMQVQFEADLTNYTPSTLAKKPLNAPLNINVSTSNDETSLRGSSTGFISEFDLCVPGDKRKETAAKYGIKVLSNPKEKRGRFPFTLL